MGFYSKNASITCDSTNGCAVHGGEGSIDFEVTIGGTTHTANISSDSIGFDNLFITPGGATLTIKEGWFDIQSDAGSTPSFHSTNTPSDILTDNDTFEVDAHNNAVVQFAQGVTKLTVTEPAAGGEVATYFIDWDTHNTPVDLHRDSGTDQRLLIEVQGENSIVGLYQTNI